MTVQRHDVGTILIDFKLDSLELRGAEEMNGWIGGQMETKMKRKCKCKSDIETNISEPSQGRAARHAAASYVPAFV